MLNSSVSHLTSNIFMNVLMILRLNNYFKKMKICWNIFLSFLPFVHFDQQIIVIELDHEALITSTRNWAGVAELDENLEDT